MAFSRRRFWTPGKPVALALQGGGSHGAFTWGVLDRLIEIGRLDVRAISGASAGAMNAVVATMGVIEGGRDGAREKLEAFWKDVSSAGALYNPGHANPWDALLRAMGPPGAGAAVFFEALTRATSPYDRNPLDFHPLRDVLERHVDFARLAAESPVALHVGATHVPTGRARIFSGGEITAAAVTASACLPMVFRAVEIDGEPYWDGGYAANPPLAPLLTRKTPQDVLLVLLNPLSREGAPKSADAIVNRQAEVVFNAPLLADLAHVARARSPANSPVRLLRRPVDRLRLHAITGGEALSPLQSFTKTATDWRLLEELRDLGREAAMAWSQSALNDVGRRETFNPAGGAAA